MAPRAYDNTTRQRQQAELKSQITAAAAELHAVHGLLGTSYAQIAQRTGVSVPTVYKHFPTLNDLAQACTSHAATLAPPMPAARIEAAESLEAAVHLLVDAMDRVNAFYAPWLVWTEDRRVPAVAATLERERRALTDLCGRILQLWAGEPDRDSAKVWAALLGFDFWNSMLRDHKMSRRALRDRLARLLLGASAPSKARR